MTPCVGKEGYPGVICLRISHLGSPVAGLLANGMAVLFILATCLLCPLLAHVTFEDPPSRASIGILRPKCKLPKVTSFPSNSPADRIVLVRISTTWRSSVEGPADSTTPATRVAVDYVVAKIPLHAISHQNTRSFSLPLLTNSWQRKYFLSKKSPNCRRKNFLKWLHRVFTGDAFLGHEHPHEAGGR